MSINQTITLSGQDDIAPDEIDFPENSYFYIGGKAPPNKVLGTQLDGTLDYLNNDFSANSIRADGTPITQRITCFTTEILIEGQINLQSSNPILIEGEYHNDSHLGIKDDKLGWYLDNITPFKIELLDDDGDILTKVECMATDILLNGWCHFTSEIPFKIDEDIGGPNKVLGIDGTGLMKWIDDVSPVIPITSDLDINSLIVEGLVPNIPSYGVIIKNGLRVDGLASFKGVLGVVIDNNLRVDGTANFKGSGGVLIDNDLSVNGLMTTKKGLYSNGDINLIGNLVLSSFTDIDINGDEGSVSQVIAKDNKNRLKWLDINEILPPSPDNLQAGLNIDATQLSSGVIATNQDLINLNNIKMNDAEPRFFVGANFGAGASPAVLGSSTPSML